MYGEDIIVRYLQDAEAAERHFEDALSSFSKMGDQAAAQAALSQMSSKAHRQHERLEARIKEFGASTSPVKSAVAHFLGFSPVLAQLGQAPAEKSTQHLMVTIAAAAAQLAMYEALCAAAQAAGDTATEEPSRDLQQEEREDYLEASALLDQSALDAFHALVNEGQKPADIIVRYLEDAIAAEKSFESQLRDFAQAGSSEQIHRLFLQHADETQHQYERLTARLRQMGGEPSAGKSFLAQLFAWTPKIAQLGHDTVERITQNLIVTYSVENSEVAMYESLIAVAEAAGDHETAALAGEIQREERDTAEKIWRLIGPWAHTSFNKLAAEEQVAT